jgi:hypothetical protein
MGGLDLRLADQAVGIIHLASDAHRPVPPRRRPAVAVSEGAGDHVVAVTQGHAAAAAYSVIGVAADEAVVGVHGPGDADRPVNQRRRTSSAAMPTA